MLVKIPKPQGWKVHQGPFQFPTTNYCIGDDHLCRNPGARLAPDRAGRIRVFETIPKAVQTRIGIKATAWDFTY